MNEDSLEQPHANPSVPSYTTSTETPRVDAEIKRQENWSNEVHATTYGWMVMSDFARRLEKELSAAKAEVEQLKNSLWQAENGKYSAKHYAMQVLELEQQLSAAVGERDCKRSVLDKIEVYLSDIKMHGHLDIHSCPCSFELDEALALVRAELAK